MRTRSAFLIRTAAALAAGSLPQPARADDKKPLVIGYVPSTLFAPVFVAVDRGYFAAEGFAPDLQPIVAGQDAMALAATGRLDMVAAGLSAAFFNAVQRGLDVRFVASTAYQPKDTHPSALVVRNDLWDAGTVRKPADLKGRKVAWTGGLGAISTYYVARILRDTGIGVKDLDVQSIATPDQAVALDRKLIDAVFASSPTLEEFADRKLARFLAPPPAGISGSGLFFGANLLKDPAAAKAALRAARRGAADLLGAGYGKPENVATLATWTKQPPETIRRSPQYDFDRRLRVDRATLADLQKVLGELGVLAYQTPLDDARTVADF